MPRQQRDAFQEANNVKRIELVTMKCEYIRHNNDYLQVKVTIPGLSNTRVEFIPWGVVWYKEGETEMQVHRWFAERKGFI